MPLSPRTKNRIRRLLLRGKLSIRQIARRLEVTRYSVERLRRQLGLAEPEGYKRSRKRVKRCRGCGHPRRARASCPVCEHAFRLEVARRRREFERQLRENPMSVLNTLDQIQRRRAAAKHAGDRR